MSWRLPSEAPPQPQANFTRYPREMHLPMRFECHICCKITLESWNLWHCFLDWGVANLSIPQVSEPTQEYYGCCRWGSWESFLVAVSGIQTVACQVAHTFIGKLSWASTRTRQKPYKPIRITLQVMNISCTKGKLQVRQWGFLLSWQAETNPKNEEPEIVQQHI